MQKLVGYGIAFNVFEHCVARFRAVGERHVNEDGLAAYCLQCNGKFSFVDKEVLFAAFAVNHSRYLTVLAVTFCGVAANVGSYGCVEIYLFHFRVVIYKFLQPPARQIL